MRNPDQVLAELNQVISDGFTGSVTLHCNDGAVVKYDITASVRSGRVRGLADLSESAGNGDGTVPPKPSGPPAPLRSGRR